MRRATRANRTSPIALSGATIRRRTRCCANAGWRRVDVAAGPDRWRWSVLDGAQRGLERVQPRQACSVALAERLLAEGDQRGPVGERLDLDVGGGSRLCGELRWEAGDPADPGSARSFATGHDRIGDLGA